MININYFDKTNNKNDPFLRQRVSILPSSLLQHSISCDVTYTFDDQNG